MRIRKAAQYCTVYQKSVPTKTQLSLAPDLLGDDPDVALALVLLLLLDLLHRQVLPLLPVYGAALALEDLRALKPKGVVLLNRKQSSEK